MMLFQKVTDEAADFTRRTGIQLFTQFNKLIADLTIDPDHQLTVFLDLFLVFFFSAISRFIPCEHNASYGQRIYNVYTFYVNVL